MFKIFISAFLIVFLTSLSAISNQINAQSINPIIFWAEGCPHCEVVKEEIPKLGLDKIFMIDFKEVSSDIINQEEFLQALTICNLDPSRAGVPMLFYKGKCSMGDSPVIQTLLLEAESIDIPPQQKIEPDVNLNTQEQESTLGVNDEAGKRNTEIVLGIILIMLLLLVAGGKALKSQNAFSAKSLAIITSLFLSLSVFVTKVSAVCPVCTVAVGAGLGLSRYFGIDDTITSIWMGGLIVSTIFWILSWLEKRKHRGTKVVLITVVLTYALAVVPLYLSGFMSAPGNTLMGIDKVFLGLTLGSGFFFLGAKLHFYFKNKFKTWFLPFQKVVLPIGSLWILTLVIYLIIYY